MATYFVRKSGNDTTGDGSTAFPWLTIDKALSVIVAGDVVLIGAGTYAENNNSGYWLISNKSYSSFVTFAPESGQKDVIITAASGSWTMTIATCAKLWFDNLIFEAQSASVQGVQRWLAGAINDVLFTRCTIRARSSSTQSNACVQSAWTVSTFTAQEITYWDCDFEQIGHWPCYGVILDNAGGANVTGVHFVLCRVKTASGAGRIKGCVNVNTAACTWASFSPMAAGTAFQLGEDAAVGANATGTISGNVVAARTGHSAVIGAGVSSATAELNTFWGGSHATTGQGLVVKNASDVRVFLNVIHGGYLSGLYAKAANKLTAIWNVVHNRYAASSCLRLGVNDENGSKASLANIRHNFFRAIAGKALDWAGSAGDAGGGINDQNVYEVGGTASLGAVRGTAVVDATDLETAWAGYDTAGNDRGSRMGSQSDVPTGVRRV